MRISDWSSDVCSSDLLTVASADDSRVFFNVRIATFFKSLVLNIRQQCRQNKIGEDANLPVDMVRRHLANAHAIQHGRRGEIESHPLHKHSHQCRGRYGMHGSFCSNDFQQGVQPFLERQYVSRSEEHTSELQSLMRISYAVFCLKQKKQHKTQTHH